MTGKTILANYIVDHSSEEVYTFLENLRNKSFHGQKSPRAFIIDWVEEDHGGESCEDE